MTDRLSPWSPRVAIYVPVGIPDEDEDQETQMAELRCKALDRGWWKVREYRERHGRAGTRPVLGQLMYRVRRRLFDLVLVRSADGFAQSLAELSENVARLYQQGIRFVAVDESIDINPETLAGRSFFEALTVLAKVEGKMISGNVRAGVARAQRAGVHCGRPRRPFPRAEARSLRTQGLTIRAIAEKFGIPESTVADALQVSGE